MELEYQNYPKFTPEMKKTHKILIPNMAPVQFRILAAVMRQAGYTCELLENCGSQVSELGLKYVHNDTCYPALLVIGQFLDALGSGKYELDHTALIITQLHPPAAQGPGEGRLRPGSGGEPELLRIGEGLRLPHDPAPDAQAPGLHLLRRPAGGPEGPDGAL